MLFVGWRVLFLLNQGSVRILKDAMQDRIPRKIGKDDIQDGIVNFANTSRRSGKCRPQVNVVKPRWRRRLIIFAQYSSEENRGCTTK